MSKFFKCHTNYRNFKSGTSWHLGIMILSKPRIVAGSHSWRELRDFYIHLRLRNWCNKEGQKKKLKVEREFWTSSGAVVKNLPASAGDTRDLGSIPVSGRSPGVGNGNQLQYSCLGNSMDRGALWAIVHGIKRVRCNWARMHTVSILWEADKNIFLKEEWQTEPYAEWCRNLRGSLWVSQHLRERERKSMACCLQSSVACVFSLYLSHTELKRVGPGWVLHQEASVSSTKESLGFPGGASDKVPAWQCRRPERRGFNPWVGKILWKRAWHLHCSWLENQWQRSLAGYGP